MNTLEELIKYCNEEEPVGALLLTGEWGCGKTYLIENMLQTSIEETMLVLRISLFGITSAIGIHMAVKQAWLEAYFSEVGIAEIAKTTKKIKRAISTINIVPDTIKGIATSDFTSLIAVKNKIGKKSFVLVFDDLERCRMDYIDTLGVINDYCENMKIHTIIVANEDKMSQSYEDTVINAIIKEGEKEGNGSSKKGILEKYIELKIPENEGVGAIPYREIKEKIVQRTVRYIPDFETIIASVINEIKYENESYKKFVLECQNELLELFAPDRNGEILSGRPHNIRSLKCAINEFYRIYEILTKNQIKDIDKWFYSFVSYVISYKAGVAREGEDGYSFVDKEVEKLYPAFQNQYIFNAVKKWILKGIWDEKEITYEIEIRKKQEKAILPSDILKTNYITDVDEDIIINGFSDILKEAYEGILTLDEYIRFVMNSSEARKYDYSFPEKIDWIKIQNGVEKCIKNLKDTLPEEQQAHLEISDYHREEFTADEWKTYEIIKNFKDANILMFIKNRKIYIEQMLKDNSTVFLLTQNKRFNVFDKEMAEVTAKAFGDLNNGKKAVFSKNFYMMWGGNIHSDDINLSESIEGFKNLLQELEGQMKYHEEQKRSFAKFHTETFIGYVTSLIDRANEEYLKQQAVDEINDELYKK